MRRVQRKPLPAFAVFQVPTAWNNRYTKAAYLGMACSSALQFLSLSTFLMVCIYLLRYASVFVGCFKRTYSLFLSFSSLQLLSRVWLFVTPWTAAYHVSLSITNSQSLLKPMSTEPVMPSNHLILCCPLLLLPSIFPSIRVFSNESVLCMLAYRSVNCHC